ncbi:MAG: hypothetical protein ACREXR_00665, partial [Gammaproteobacteria bacterium]
VNGDAGTYDYRRLNTLIKALEIACGCYPVFHQNGMARAAVVTGPAQAGQQYAGIIMPLRSKLYPYKGFKID